MQEQYVAKEIEQRVQARWLEHSSFEANDDDPRPKYFSMCMWPYPSGELHVGHLRNYALGDVWARYQRMLGLNVLQAMGWDAFGKDAELKARKEQIHPIDWVRANIKNMRRELKELGLMIDWRRELAVYNPLYYKWEQVLFVRMWEQDLVYYEDSKVLWDKSTETVTSRRDVEDGKVDRNDVEIKVMPSYLMRMRKYAKELLHGLDVIDWPDKIVKDQQYLIGMSEGMTVSFKFDQPVNDITNLEVYTTRPDTIFGVTYMAVHADHFLAKAAAANDPKLAEFCEKTSNLLPMDAGNPHTEKFGMPTPFHVINPVNDEKIPIWVADYVIDDYGSGALMGVPAHDERDFKFATKYDIPIRRVIAPTVDDADLPLPEADTSKGGVAVNSGPLDGLGLQECIDKLEQMYAKDKIAYKDNGLSLRDWPINRRMYWGTPIPIVICDSCGRVPIPEKDLPLELPLEHDRTKLLDEHPDFAHCKCPKCGKDARREPDTMDTFVSSSWYNARYTCRDATDRILDERAAKWLPVNHYFGGDEHAQGHLVYCRFIHKVMRDLDMHPGDCGDEPYSALLCQGMVQGADGKKMSKSQDNTVMAKDILDQLGADTARMYIIGIGHPKDSFPWNDEHVRGHAQFLTGLWRMAIERKESVLKGATVELTGKNLIALKKLLVNIDRNLKEKHFNNLVFGGIHSLRNLIWDNPDDLALQHQGFIHLLKVMNLVAPHIAEEIWHEFEFEGLLIDAKWWEPIKDSELVGDVSKFIVQVNGKRRDEIEVAINTDDDEILETARNTEKIARYLENKTEKQAKVVHRKGGHGIVFFVVK